LCRRKGFKVFASTINLLSCGLIGHLFWESVFIQHRDTGQMVDVFSKFSDENCVKTFNLRDVLVCYQRGDLEMTDCRFVSSLS
jgi:hypothetical protein